MSQATTEQTKPMTREEAIARLRRLRQAIDERNRDLDDAEREALVAQLASEIETGAAQRVRDRRPPSE
jgi:hypothetical protein